MKAIEISVVAPVYNGAETIVEFMRRTWESLSQMNKPFEILLVDDGSRDGSVEIIRSQMERYNDITLVKLTGNFGQSNAIAAGLTRARGKYCVVMDSDLQDKPEDIEHLYRRILEKGHDMVIASRPQSNQILRRNLASILFYVLSNRLTTIRNPRCAGVFRILKRSCLDDIFRKPVQPGTILSQLHAKGCSWSTILLERETRHDNRSSYSVRKLLNLAFTRLLVFGRIPHNILGIIGIVKAVSLYSATQKQTREVPCRTHIRRISDRERQALSSSLQAALRDRANHHGVIMPKQVIIIGGIGNGTVIADAITYACKDDNDPVVAGFLNDRQQKGDIVGSYTVLGSTSEIDAFIRDGYHFVYTIYRIDGQQERLDLFEKLKIPEDQLLTYVHPMAYVAPSARLGAGTIVMPNASISSDATLGRCCLVMVNASIGHDAVIGDFCHFAAQSCVSSRVVIEDGVHIGLNATVRENLHLGVCSTLGMGSVLLKDMEEMDIWVGNPARLLRKAR